MHISESDIDPPSSVEHLTSQASLHSNKSTQSRQNRSAAGHHSLRNMNQNTAVALSSPGPLESMLKTATETGDIGFFSIRPSPSPPSATSHHTRRLEDNPDRNMPHGSLSRNDRRHRHRDDRRRLPSYRDTTLDIVSMYDQCQPPPISPQFSPVSTDGRSYSLTTSSSRRLPEFKSHTTVPSRPSSSSDLQRPRSPFPYPTRPERPGVRPFSPSLTTNGRVDYSRMVEINDMPYSTAKQPNKAYLARPSHYRTNYPPLPYSSTAPYDTGRQFTPHGRYTREGIQDKNQSLLYTEHPYEDQSTRSPSLSSIVDEYYRPVSTQQPSCLLRPRGSFYYDYSEGFNTGPPPPRPQTAVPPYLPVPQHITKETNPWTLQGESQLPLDVIHDSVVEETNECSTRKKRQLTEGLESANYQHQQTELESIRSVSRYETPPLVPEGQVGAVVATDTGQCRIAVPAKAPIPCSPPSELSTSSNVAPGQPSEASKPAEKRGMAVVAVDGASSPGGEIQLDQNESGNAARATAHDQASATGRESSTANEMPSVRPYLERNASDIGFAGIISSRQHQPSRTQDPGIASTTDHKGLDTGVSFASKCGEKANASRNMETQVISPLPISPAHQVRVRNSIPQLMKALPQGQNDVFANGSDNTRTGVSSEGFSLPIHRSISPNACSEPQNEGILKSVDRKNQHEPTNISLSKLRLRLRHIPPSSGGSLVRPCVEPESSASTRSEGLSENIRDSKYSRWDVVEPKPTGSLLNAQGNEVCEDRDPPSGTVRRCARTTNRTAIDVLEQEVSGDFFTPAQDREGRYERRGRHFVLISPDMGDTPLAVPSLREPREPRHKEPLGTQAHPIGTDNGRHSTSMEIRKTSFDMKVDGKLGGLRKKVSNMCMRSTKSRLDLRGRATKDGTQTLNSGLDHVQEEDVNRAGIQSFNTEGALGIQSTGKGKRIRDWVLEARRKMNAYLEKTKGSDRGRKG